MDTFYGHISNKLMGGMLIATRNFLNQNRESKIKVVKRILKRVVAATKGIPTLH